MPENPGVNPFGYNFYVTEDNDTIPYKELNNVTVNEKLRVSGLKSGAPFQIMNEEELTAMGTPSLSDAVKRFAGVTVKDYGGIGGLKVVSVRGMGAEHTGVCYDGVNISNCQSGQIDISRFSLDNVSQLSLAIGQNDDIFNSAKTLASGGMLFIETRNPLENNDKPIDIKATFNKIGRAHV